ncbi:MAG: aminopeptidase P family protein [Candidatus Melainabacteria bacterium]|nr:aminopeptidase P family protein [Candidatus Melainabacteria bacterium]
MTGTHHPPFASLTAEKLTALRGQMLVHGLAGLLIPSEDEHLNEYLPKAHQRREWLTAFTGSVGAAFVDSQHAWLFVDSRYHEQAPQEVDVSQIRVVKLGAAGEPTLADFLAEVWQPPEAAASAPDAKPAEILSVGVDPFTLSLQQYRTLNRALLQRKKAEKAQAQWRWTPDNLVDVVRRQSPWATEDPIPPVGESLVFSIPVTHTGSSVSEKLSQLRQTMAVQQVQCLPLTKLDQIAWLFNLRGADVAYNPVFLAYAIVTLDQAYLFTHLSRITQSAQDALAAATVTLKPYEAYPAVLKAQCQAGVQANAIDESVPGSQCDAPKARVWVDPNHTTVGTFHLLSAATDSQPVTTNAQPLELPNPVEQAKAVKNATEIAGMQAANLKASRAKVRLLAWLDRQLQAGAVLSEAAVAERLEALYAEEEGLVGLSFNTILAAGAHGSIVHYGTPSQDTCLQHGMLCLIDSGAQYLDATSCGTTDDTRTVVVGAPTARQRFCYTEVLKAHIYAAAQVFPEGTNGVQIDSITRSCLWHQGLDYGHGTGHGVGAFLNVHEGPNGIHRRAHTAFEPGMITSIEPGYYEAGWGGIRLENLYRVVPHTQPFPQESAWQATWFAFESLTYIPFDNRLIDPERLGAFHRRWLAQYYQAVWQKLSPLLSGEELAWLQQATQPSFL